jgi:hypothetical protein
MPFEKGDPRARRGYARMKAIAQEDEFVVAGRTQLLLAELGRSPTVAEQMQAETLVRLLRKAERLRSISRNDLDVLREASALMRAVPWLLALHEPDPPSPPIAPSA